MLVVLFDNQRMNSYKADGLRIVNGTHTTVRRLDVLSSLIQHIGLKHLPLEILKLQITQWSLRVIEQWPEHEKVSGKLTNSRGKLTTAFNHYINLLDELGLVLRLGQTVSLSKMGHFLRTLLEKKEEYDFHLTLSERLFYLYLLFEKDADLLFTVIGQVQTSKNSINQKQVQEGFESYLLDRLIAKSKFSEAKTKFEVLEKKRVIEIEWREAQTYAEHIAVPRLEWLEQLGIVGIKSANGHANYSIVDSAMPFLSKLIFMPDSSHLDVNVQWLSKHAFSSFALLPPFSSLNLIPFTDLSQNQKKEIVGEGLLEAFKHFKGGGAMRIGVSPTFPYLCIRSVVEKKVAMNYSDIVEALEKPLTADHRIFSYRPAARKNEGYILIKPIVS